MLSESHYYCEHENDEILPREIIPNEYDNEYDILSGDARWPRRCAYIILKTCPTYQYVEKRKLAETEHLALIREE